MDCIIHKFLICMKDNKYLNSAVFMAFLSDYKNLFKINRLIELIFGD